MFPDKPNISSTAVRGKFLPPFPQIKEPLKDVARGGIDLLDASKGLNQKDWFGEARNGDIYIKSESGVEQKIHSVGVDVNWFSFSFDQNMRLCIAYSIDKTSFMYWHNEAIHDYETISLGKILCPTVRLDDISDAASGESELILSYLTFEGSLCVRLQRDRFLQEYVLSENCGNDILQCGMTSGRRFQWDVTTSYPRYLPCPQADITLQPRERRYISDITDVRNVRKFQHEFQANYDSISFIYTEEETSDFRQWYNETLVHGGAWFYATWPVLNAEQKIAFRFASQPCYEWLFGANPGASGRGGRGFTLGKAQSAVPIYKVSIQVELYERSIVKTFTTKLYPYYFGDDVTSSNIDALAYMLPRIRLEDDIQAAPIFISSATMKEWIFSKYTFEDDITATPISIKEVRTNGWKYSTYSFEDDISVTPVTITDVRSTGWGYLDYPLMDDITASQITITAGVLS